MTDKARARGKRLSRRDVRLARAEATCRELRYAIANPWLADWSRVADLLLEWLKVGPSNKFDRP